MGNNKKLVANCWLRVSRLPISFFGCNRGLPKKSVDHRCLPSRPTSIWIKNFVQDYWIFKRIISLHLVSSNHTNSWIIKPIDSMWYEEKGYLIIWCVHLTAYYYLWMVEILYDAELGIHLAKRIKIKFGGVIKITGCRQLAGNCLALLKEWPITWCI